MKILEKALSYDDVTLVPQYSNIKSRSGVDLTMKLYAPSAVYEFSNPVISSPMSTVTEDEMAFRMFINGGLGIIHRFNTIERQVELVKSAFDKFYEWEQQLPEADKRYRNSEGAVIAPIFGAAIGATGDYIERFAALVLAGVKIICIDIAHGDHIIMKEAVSNILEIRPSDVHVMVSSIATPEAMCNIYKWGADSGRVGISHGANCSTYLATGHGMPTLQSLIDCKNELTKKTRYGAFAYDEQNKFGLIADCGMRHPGDIAKAFAAGASMAMLGSMLAGTKATPGHIIKSDDGRWLKEHRGSASEANQKLRGIKDPKVEGVSALVPYKGKVENVMKSIKDGLQSACSYSGVDKLVDLHDKALFREITASGHIQGTPHIFNKK